MPVTFAHKLERMPHYEAGLAHQSRPPPHGRADGDIHDLDAMVTEVTAATQLVLVCNPNNPTGTHLPAAQIAAFCERVPGNAAIILDEAYVEFQLHDDPDATVDLLVDFPNLVV